MKVTIRCERADGQFTVAQTDVPDQPPATGPQQNDLEDKILAGFIRAYRDCSELLGMTQGHTDEWGVYWPPRPEADSTPPPRHPACRSTLAAALTVSDACDLAAAAVSAVLDTDALEAAYERGRADERARIRVLMDEHHENADCDITWLADLLDAPTGTDYPGGRAHDREGQPGFRAIPTARP